ncbi:DUF6158 family protein (plasmid) [Streptomyces sp. BI20]|uniref:DUF6158 family protein n=1 Tax=Streptomyces sp. BI20 TaxID=3403460 RepID=UPI003C783FA6
MTEPREGGAARELDDATLLKELETIHRTRHATFLHGSDRALETHSRRLRELEEEYLSRHPDRAPSGTRTRAGARSRTTAEED